MSTTLASLIYLSAIVLPLWLLYQSGPKAWYWHLASLAAALVVGFAPGTPLLQTVAGTFIYGFVFLALVIWGIGGPCVAVYRRITYAPLSRRAASR